MAQLWPAAPATTPGIAGAGASTSGSVSLGLVDKWRQFDFIGVQDSADTAAAEIAKRQEESDLSRVRLIEFSKEFRQTTSDDVRRQVQPLLKSFQSEIDNLLKRSKAAESAFLSVYKALRELPDPSALVDCFGRLDDKSSENIKLRETIDELNRNLTQSRNQDEERIRNMDAEWEGKMWHSVQEQVAVEVVEREAEWNEERRALERRLAEAEGQAGILRRELDRSFEQVSKARPAMQQQGDDHRVAFLTEEVERANQRALTAEYKVADLQQQVTTLQQSSSDTVQVSQQTAFRQQNQHESVQRLRDELDRLKSSYQSQFTRLEGQLAHANTQNTALLARLDQQRDYDEVKQQFGLLKAAYCADDLPGDSLEAVLLARSRRLESENAVLRVRESELTESLEKLRRDFAEQSLVVQSQKELTERLESDLYQLKELINPSATDPLSNLVSSGLSTSPDFVNDALRSTSNNLSRSVSSAAVTENDTAVYSSILERQLSRFHARAKELEQVNSQQQTQLLELKVQLDTAKTDNVGLYERIRFLQSYDVRKHKEPSHGSGAVQDIESRYATVYESNLDPFSSFHRTEKLRKYHALGPVDKATLAMGQMVLGSSRARKAFFIYALILHLLVFGIIYRLALSESNLRDYSYDCATRFAEHMDKEHHHA